MDERADLFAQRDEVGIATCTAEASPRRDDSAHEVELDSAGRCAPGRGDITTTSVPRNNASSIEWVMKKIDFRCSAQMIDDQLLHGLAGQASRARRTARPSAGSRDRSRARAPGRRAGACRRRADRSATSRSRRAPPAPAVRAPFASRSARSMPASFRPNATLSRTKARDRACPSGTPRRGPAGPATGTSVHGHRALGQRQEPGHGVQQGRLAAARSAERHHEALAGDGQGRIRQRMDGEGVLARIGDAGIVRRSRVMAGFLPFRSRVQLEASVA